jgi:hypothetical protein
MDMIEKIFILHHTHVDFGYTDSREKVIGDYQKMIDQTMDLVDHSSNRCKAEQFHWVHEVSWPVLDYLRNNPEKQKERLFEQIRQGHQELTAFYVNPTDLFDYDSLRISTDYACDLAEEHHLPLTTAMFSDCPGLPWSVVDILGERGVKYLSAAPDFIMSFPLDVERPFYWEGPNGHRLLTWFTEWRNFWYAEGLFTLKLHEEPTGATTRLNDYIQQIEDEGYRWKGLAIHVGMDNEGPRPELMDFVARYNASNSGREICMATNAEFFEYMEKHHTAEFPVYKAAWPDWWANGNAAGAYETSCSRKAKASLKRSEIMAKQLGKTIDPKLMFDIREDIIQYDEHTFGHSTSVSNPWSTMARLQWAQKRAFALNGKEKAVRLEMDLYKNLHPENKKAHATEAKSTEEPAPFTGMENDHFRVDYDASTGKVRNIYDKINRFDLFDTKSEWSVAELIHEKVMNGSREAMYDVSLGPNKPEAKRPRPEFVRTAGHDAQNENSIKVVPGTKFNSLITSGKLPGVRFNREIRLFHEGHRIDIVLRLDKQVDVNYESLYLAFPFAAKLPKVFVENAGAVYQPGVEQIPGSATDWHSIGDYLAVNDGHKTMVLVPHDVPLVQIGDIHTGKWQKKLEITTGHIFSWIMNNMWFTNFPAYQEGVMEFTWSLTSYAGEFSEKAVHPFAFDTRVGSTNPELEQKSIVW